MRSILLGFARAGMGVVGAWLLFLVVLTQCSYEDVEISGGEESSSGSTSSSSETSSPSGSSPQVAATVEAKLAEGQSGTTTGLKLTISKITDPYTPASQYTKPALGNRFVAVKLMMENTGSVAVSTQVYSFKLSDAQGFQYDDKCCLFNEPGLDDAPSELSPGGKAEGWIGFEIKEGVAIKELLYDRSSDKESDIRFKA